MDFSGFQVNNRSYSGSERKLGISIDERNYILKFRKADVLGQLACNHVCEHIGSRIIASAGITSQKTQLGTYKGEEVVAIRDFCEDSTYLPFQSLVESSMEFGLSPNPYSYDGIMEILRGNRKLSNVEETVESFWDLYIMDALLGNLDRHGYNWGFLKKDGKYRLAPVFDNGSCLYPQMTDDDDMMRVINSEEETNQRVYRFPTSQIRLGDRKSSYYDVISSLKFDECNKAVLRMFPRIDLEKSFRIIDDVETISDVHKMFYRHMLRSRYSMILEPAYRRLADEV